MGIDADIVKPTKLIEETCVCAICMTVFKDPVQLSCCKNHFCRECLAQDNENCPLCRNPQVNTITASPSLLRLLGKVKLRCVHETCPETQGILYQEFERHVENCNHIPATCPHCKSKVSELLLNDHNEICIQKWKNAANQNQKENETLRRANRVLSDTLEERTRQYETERELNSLQDQHQKENETLRRANRDLNDTLNERTRRYESERELTSDLLGQQAFLNRQIGELKKKLNGLEAHNGQTVEQPRNQNYILNQGPRNLEQDSIQYSHGNGVSTEQDNIPYSHGNVVFPEPNSFHYSHGPAGNLSTRVNGSLNRFDNRQVRIRWKQRQLSDRIGTQETVMEEYLLNVQPFNDFKNRVVKKTGFSNTDRLAFQINGKAITITCAADVQEGTDGFLHVSQKQMEWG